VTHRESRHKRRRAWKKLHLATDADTGQIIASELTSHDVDDGSQVDSLLDQVDGPPVRHRRDVAVEGSAALRGRRRLGDHGASFFFPWFQPSRPAATLTSTEVKRLLASCGTDLAGLRDRALLLAGFAGALRRSELVALDREHLRFTPDGMTLRIPRSKRDQEGEGADPGLPRGLNPLSCPARAAAAGRTLCSLPGGDAGEAGRPGEAGGGRRGRPAGAARPVAPAGGHRPDPAAAAGAAAGAGAGAVPAGPARRRRPAAAPPAALASTLLAGLELARDGTLTLHQDHAFGAIRLTPGPGEAPRPTAAA
jgi:hypothetical protein